MNLFPKDIKSLLQASLGEIPSDTVITNVKVVNVFTGEILPANVFIKDGYFSHIQYKDPDTPDGEADHVVDGKGMYMAPGFLDAHMHIESSMLTPRNLAKAIIPHGTTTIITDPHEVGNVLGVRGVKYMHDSAEDLPMRQLIDIPSCVPAVPGMEYSGADFKAKEIEELAKLDRVVGLAEVMDCIAVMNGDDRMLGILAAARKHGLYLQGHAPMLSGRDLSAYLAGGPYTDHETSDSQEALEKYRNGMYLDACDSSICHNVEAVFEGIRHSKYFDTLCLCTDDREAGDLLALGHINDTARHLIGAGVDPVTAIKSITINIAREARLERIGAIAPGYVADFNLLENLEELNPVSVWYGGEKVAENGKLLKNIEDRTYPEEEINTMNVRELTEEDFTVKCPVENGRVSVNVIVYPSVNSSYTVLEQMEMEVKDGKLVLPENHMFAAVINRYGKDHISLAVLRNFGIDHGALSSTVSHDSHNLTLVYDEPRNAVAAANVLRECGGGMAAAEDGKVIEVLELPICGLLSKLGPEETAERTKRMKEADRKLGLQILNPLLRIAVLALPVIPEYKISDMGIIDVAKKEYVPLFDEQ
ncbi:MAG: adenine deaminase [Solobacterium sp.]|nr:adenine deaminase [Solobacterium sp.]